MSIVAKLGLGVFVVGAFIALSTAFGSFYSIDETERGVVLRNGAVVGQADPGLSWKLPWVDTVKEISVAQHAQRFDQLPAYSMDQQSAELVVSVNYRIPPDQVIQLYSQYQSTDNLVLRLINPRVAEEVKTVFGRFTAETAIRDRGRLNAEVMAAIKKSITGPVLIESVQIENIDFSDIYEKSVEARMLAEVEVAKIVQNGRSEVESAKIVVTRATAAADAVRAAAKAEADAITLKGNAEATAINAKGKALRDNPGLVSLISAERWSGILPTTMVPGGAVPFIDVGKTLAQ